MIIGLTGKGEVGKSEAAKYLAGRYGYLRTHVKDPMVEMAIPLMRRLGVHEDEIMRRLDGDLKNEPIPEFPHLSGRLILQVIGGEFKNAIDPLIFIKLWWRQYEGQLIVNESVRYPEEGDFIRERGGIVIRIKRPGRDGVNGHMSEHQPVVADAEIWNDGPIEILHARLDGLVNRYVRAA